VEAAARGLADANLTVLNGTQGVHNCLAGFVGQGLSILDLLKKSAANGNVTGTAPVPVTEGVKPGGGTGGVADLN
jgi:hypothetical protein